MDGGCVHKVMAGLVEAYSFHLQTTSLTPNGENELMEDAKVYLSGVKSQHFKQSLDIFSRGTAWLDVWIDMSKAAMWNLGALHQDVSVFNLVLQPLYSSLTGV